MRSRLRLTAAILPLTCCAFALTGCNDRASEKIDSRPPANMPTPTMAGAKPVEKKAAAPVVPPPTEAEMGIPIYPGAKTYVDSGGVAVAAHNDPAMSTATLETPDSVDKVVDFYRQRLTQSDASGVAQPVEPREDTQDGKRKVVLLGNDAQGSSFLAEVREDTGKTMIELMRTQMRMPSALPDTATPTSAPPTGTPAGAGGR